MAVFDEQVPIQIGVWSRQMGFQGWVFGPHEISGTVRYNAASDCTFSVDADHDAVERLTIKGARVVVRYMRPIDEIRTLISGTVEEVNGDGVGGTAIRTFTVRDDFNLFNDIIGVPNPAGDMSEQGDSGTHDVHRGPAETVLKDVLAANATRQGIPITIDTDQGRGNNLALRVRMASLYDLFFPLLNESGIYARLVQVGDEIQCRVYTPVTYQFPITEGSGLIESGSFNFTNPTVTRVIVGAQGEGTARHFEEYVALEDGTAVLIEDVGSQATWESLYGLVRCGFVDARDIEAGANEAEDMRKRAEEALAEGQPTTGLSLTLVENDAFRFGVSYDVGVKVQVKMQHTPMLSDIVREVEYAWTPDDGLRFTPKVGAWDDSADARLINIVRKAARGVRQLQRSY